MRILIHSINYAPEITSTGKYVGEMGEWLVAQGHEVRVVTAPPYYPAWQVMEGYSALRYRRERIAGAEVWRCPTWVPAKPSGTKRLLHLASFAVGSFPAMLGQVTWRPEVVMVTEPPVLCVPSSWLVARLCRAKMWLHIMDFEFDVAVHLGMLRGSSGSVRRLLYHVERLLMQRADRISTISERMRYKILEKGISADRTRLFPNWSDIEFVRPLPQDDAVRQEFGAGPNDVLVLHAGNMGEKQSLELVLDAAEQLKDRTEIKFALVGAGAARAKLEEIAEQRRLTNVRFFPVQPLERLPALLAAGDIHLVVQRREAADLVMPSKLTNILAAGKPSIATADPGTALHDIVHGYECGVTTSPGSVAELAASVVELADNPGMRQRLGWNARRYAESYLDKGELLRDFENSLKELVVARGK